MYAQKIFKKTLYVDESTGECWEGAAQMAAYHYKIIRNEEIAQAPDNQNRVIIQKINYIYNYGKKPTQADLFGL